MYYTLIQTHVPHALFVADQFSGLIMGVTLSLVDLLFALSDCIAFAFLDKHLHFFISLSIPPVVVNNLLRQLKSKQLILQTQQICDLTA